MVHVPSPDLSNDPHYREIEFGSSLHSFNVPAPEDYYSLLSFDLEDAPSEDDIKSSYRRLQRSVHPDVVGKAAGPLAIVLNAAYKTLMDADLRAAYDQQLKEFRKVGGTFDGRPVSGWRGEAGESRAVFVAENECIGCKQCTQIAGNTFFLEEEHGRARVRNQWADEEDVIDEAVQTCPVDCIYYVQRAQLPILEFVMKSCKRENPGLMGRRRSGSFGPELSCECPFERAMVYVKARKNVEVDSATGARTFGRPLHDGELSAAIAAAWLQLPHDARVKAWPEWTVAGTAAGAGAAAAQPAAARAGVQGGGGDGLWPSMPWPEWRRDV